MKLHQDRLIHSFGLESFETCESCLLGKMTKAPFARHSERASDLLGLIHTDVCGPISSILEEVISTSLLLPMTLADMVTSTL